MDLHAWLNILYLRAEGVSVGSYKSRHRSLEITVIENLYIRLKEGQEILQQKKELGIIFSLTLLGITTEHITFKREWEVS